MYHKIDVITPTLWWVSRSQFLHHMTILDRLTVVHLDDYDPTDPTHCVITFDDSYENVYRHALPILKAKRYPFEVFTNGDLIGKWNHFDTIEPLTRFCSLDQLIVMAANGGRIQWHTRSHPNLTSIDLPAALRELDVPTWLRDQFPAPHLRWLAYPYGAHTPSIVDEAKDLFSGALSVVDGSNTDRYMFNRITVSEDLGLQAIIKDGPSIISL
jgi:peptidoglycan/xylan/chitin deacetylase (PgdA/CDA1 family)